MPTQGTNMAEIRERAVEELSSSLDRARDELFRFKLGRFTNQVENTMQIRNKRREIARIQTVLTERRLGLVVTSASTGPRNEVPDAQTATKSATKGAPKATPAAAAKASGGEKPAKKTTAKAPASKTAKPKAASKKTKD